MIGIYKVNFILHEYVECIIFPLQNNALLYKKGRKITTRSILSSKMKQITRVYSMSLKIEHNISMKWIFGIAESVTNLFTDKQMYSVLIIVNLK